MAMVQYLAMLAVNPGTGLPNLNIRNLTGQIVQPGTTTPVPIWEDMAKTIAIPSSQLTITDQGYTPGFWADTFEVLEWWDGTNRVVIWSPQGLTNAAIAAQASSEAAAAAASDEVAAVFADQTAAAVAAQAAAEDARDIAAAAGAALPDGGNVGDVLYRGATPRTGQWLPAPTGGGTAVVDWNVAGSIQNKPPTFPPSAHNTAIDTLRTADGGNSLATIVLNLLKATSPDAIRTLIGAGTGNGTSNVTLGRASGQAMPGDVALSAAEITVGAISGVSAGNAQGVLAELAARPSGGSGGGGNVYTRDYASGAYPVRGTLPTGAVVYWRGPVAPTIGGLYATSVDRWEVTA
ncbi:hypothetical protein [Cellulomonas rhizosphaerae]|uniref:Uncharacterized protein n=1 Tax=Cellulomonas rhizosphaerae TaxID=2293719 RepID=A0A413RNY7_9CELL|nr:hypothetical protein [Cellulomonas rhizosphaerae]RHA43677.1 hypothetical protein D1825_05180 [Cellulomonas rhizosphaerae]